MTTVLFAVVARSRARGLRAGRVVVAVLGVVGGAARGGGSHRPMFENAMTMFSQWPWLVVEEMG